ncbi:MAG: hypothetical protein IMZ44_21615 [Planctomycetes bacterium]|nr:hypothetical protein [Planctomycetota bacterium]
MQPLAFWMPGHWEIIILGACGFFFLAVAVAAVLVVIYLTRRKSQGQPQAPPKPQ